MNMRYIWKNDERHVRFTDSDQDPASGYNEDASDFIMTGEWGALDPNKNQHLIPFRNRYLARIAKDNQ